MPMLLLFPPLKTAWLQDQDIFILTLWVALAWVIRNNDILLVVGLTIIE